VFSSPNRRVCAITALALCLATVSIRAADVVTPRVLADLPHDTNAFTQGFLYYNGFFYESTGLYGESKLRRIDPATGAALQQISLGPDLFGEGLARIDDELIQITWRENVAYRYTLQDFWQVQSHSYSGEGWGICFDGERLVMSNGTSYLTFRDPETFASLGTVQVTLNSIPISRLNELECVGSPARPGSRSETVTERRSTV